MSTKKRKSSPSTLNKEDQDKDNDEKHDDIATIKRLKSENDSLKEELKTTKEKLKKKEEEEEEEEEKESFKCCSHIDESGWTTKRNPNHDEAYHDEEYCSCDNHDSAGCNTELEPVQPAEYYGRIIFNCECMIGDTFKGLQSHTFTILCDTCEEERYHPKSCISCDAKQSKKHNYPILLDGEGFCQRCIKNGGREDYMNWKKGIGDYEGEGEGVGKYMHR